MPNKKKNGNMNFEKQYGKIMKDVTPYYPRPEKQWKATGDIFEKFSLLEKSPTTTSSNTVAIKEQKTQNA